MHLCMFLRAGACGQLVIEHKQQAAGGCSQEAGAVSSTGPAAGQRGKGSSGVADIEELGCGGAGRIMAGSS